MRKTFALLLILFFVATAVKLHAQDPRYDAWYQSLVKEFTLNPDGSTDMRYQKIQKLLSYRAFHRLYGETFIVYNPAFQQLKINEAFTVMADGRKVSVPANAFNEVLPGFAANAPDFSNLREMVITHTGLERNATIHLDYQVHTSAGAVQALMGNELLAASEPAGSLIIRIRIPEGKTLLYEPFNGAGEPERSKEAGFTVYTWKRQNVPAVSSEDFQAGGTGSYPRILFTTAAKPGDLYTSLVSLPAFQQNLSEPMKAAIAKLSEENKDKFELALKIQELVVDQLRYYPVSFSYALFQCRQAEQVWNGNGGTSVEKATLLASLMKEAGMNAYVVAVVKTPDARSKACSFAGIEDFAVAVNFKKEDTWYFSVTALNAINLKWSLPGRSFVTLIPGQKAEVVPAGEPAQLTRITGTLVVSSDPKITGELLVYQDGSAFPYAGMKRDPKKMKKALTGGLGSADIQDAKSTILNPENGAQTFIVNSDKPLKRDSGFINLTLPSMSSGIDNWYIKTLSSKRETSFEIPSLAEEKYSYTFTLPSNLSVFTPGQEITIKNKAGEFSWEVSKASGKVTVRRQIKFNQREFNPQLFREFKELMDGWNNPRYRELIFTVRDGK